VLGSISRLSNQLNPPPVINASRHLLELLSAYNKAEDLINIGAYVEGSNPLIDRARRLMDKINAFLTQEQHQKVDLASSRKQLLELAASPDSAASKRR
jgi:flagellum-specific ATP synthase